ncbi:MAG: hypothetical protein HKM06_04625 [Spirochaetales bacterium]|nr:hypothetical protein [Spirochaetales bacterium]
MKIINGLKQLSLLVLLGVMAVSCAQKVAPKTRDNPAVYHFSLTILPGEVQGKPGWPFYTPADFTLPPDSEVVVTITNYDPGTEPVPSGRNVVSGTEGNSELANGKPVSSLEAGLVSHTFSIEKLKLNVPVPPLVKKSGPGVVVFRFHTPAEGTYPWQCWAACGSGKSGWEGAMSTEGFMTGTLKVSRE